MPRIPFMDPLVLQIRADKKDVTRRLKRPRFKVGDLVDVCEALVPHATDANIAGRPSIAYRCDGTIAIGGHPRGPVVWPWQVRVLAARYCPGWAVRTRIRIVDIREEGLVQISNEDVIREGVARIPSWSLHPFERPADGFTRMFRDMHKLDIGANPTVFRIEFKREAP